MNKYLCSLLVAAFFLGGCAMTPLYTRPEAPVPATWPTDMPTDTATGPKDDTLDATDLNWREFFTDSRLQAVIQTALDHNRDLKLAALNVERARAMYGIQRSALYPALDATANASKQRTPADLTSSGAPEHPEQYGVKLGVLSWEIDFFGRIRSLRDQALESFLATEQARRSAQILLISAVANAYLTLAADRETLQLAETTLTSQQAAYALIDRRREVGLTSELDLYRAQTQVDIARGDIARAIQLIAQDQNALNLLVGTTFPISETLLPTDLAGVGAFRPIDAGVSSEVLLGRPDILQAESLLKAANANIGAARAALFPRISLTTTLGTASSELSGLFAGGSGTWLFNPGISLPVFDARLWSALDATLVEREIVLTQYEKAIQTAFREVADALAVRGTMDERISAQESLARAASATYRLSDARYAKGIDSYLGVLDAQRAMYAAQQGIVSLNLAKLANQVRLFAVLGGGAR